MELSRQSVVTYQSSLSTYSVQSERNIKNDLTPSPFTIEFHRQKSKQKHRFRQNWESTADFTICCLCHVVCVDNYLEFPFYVLENGGIVFIICYIIISIFLIYPIILIQMNLGQFFGRSITKVWEYCPVMAGVALVMIASVLLQISSDADKAGWSVFYVIKSFNEELPWSKCGENTTNISCLNLTTFFNESQKANANSSGYAFWLFYFEEDIDSPFHGNINSIILSSSMAIITFGMFISLCYRESSSYVFWATFFWFYAILFYLLLLAISSGDFVKYILLCLTPSLQQLKDVKIYFYIFACSFMSYGLGYGGLITLASLNRFNDNYLFQAKLIILFKILTNILSVCIIFPFIGYYVERGSILEDNRAWVFARVVERLSMLPLPNLRCILLFLSIIFSNFTSIAIMFRIFIIGMKDMYAEKYNVKDIILIYLFLWTQFTCFCITHLYNRAYSFKYIHNHIILPSVMIILQLQIGSYCYIYGFKNIRRDMTMLLNKSLNTLWEISLIVASVIMVLLTMYFSMKLFKFDFIPILRIFIFLILRDINLVRAMKKKDHLMSWTNCFYGSFRESKIWGPRLTKFWTDHPYNLKLKLYKNEIKKNELDVDASKKRLD